MPDIADQLRRYGDAVVEHHGPSERPLTTAPPPDRLANEQGRTAVTSGRPGLPPRRSARLVLVAAAAIVLAGVGVAAVWETTATVSTDLPSSTTAPTVVEPVRPESVAPQMLPDPGEWQMVAFDRYDDPAEPSLLTSDVVVFDLDGRTLLLLSQASASPLTPLASSQPTSENNRSRLAWTADGQRLSLMGFDTDPDRLADAAESLRLENGRWRIDGAEVILDEPGRSQAAISSTQIRYAQVDAAGNLDPNITIDQHGRTASLGDLYRELHEASSLGNVARIETRFGTGWTMTGGPVSYALVYSNDIITSWQSSLPSSELAAFINSLEPADDTTWNDAIAGGPDMLSEAVERQAHALPPIEVAELPRFVLNEPYELVAVNDPSQWTDEQRRQLQASQDAVNGKPDYQILLNQTFRLADNANALVPDVVVQTQRAIGQRLPDMGNDDAQTISLPASDDPSQRYEGVIYSNDPARPTSATAVVVLGDITLEIISPTLTPDSLATLIESMSARTSGEGGVTVDLDNAGLVPGIEVTQPPTSLASGWSAVYSYGPNPGDRIQISVDSQPLGHTEVELAYTMLYGAEIETTAPGEPYIVVRNAGGGGYLLWPGIPAADDGNEAAVRLFGGTTGPAEIARSLRQVDEADWVQTVAPFITPPALGEGN